MAPMTATASPTAPTVWDGSGTQADLMLRDQVIAVTEADVATGGASKRDAHTFSGSTPSGVLHRAFSVFLFDDRDRLLLQRRADAKITFPGVWTNTCCSHQLHGQAPDEVDSPSDVAAGRAPGSAAAAVRKLEHELGIKVGTIPPSAFRFVTRLHYCAPDESSPGSWGEHEVDYVLIARAPAAGLGLNPNREEVSDTRWVDPAELRAMMAPASGLSWSPWFRIIAERWLPTWWGDLDGVLSEGKHVDAATVHRVM